MNRLLNLILRIYIYIRYITCISQILPACSLKIGFNPTISMENSVIGRFLGEMVTGHLQRASGTTVWEA